MTTQELIRRPIFFAISVFWLWLKERFCNPIGYPRSEQYQWHGKWRVDLVKRRITRRWERFSFKDFLKRQRWFWVLLSGVAACAISLWVITDGLWLTSPTKENFAALRNSSGSWTLLTALISAPIAFVIWWFRDTNTLWQIENQRKDTNLKDFHQLSQWASGLHLIEAEKTVTTGDEKITEAIKSSIVVTKNNTDTLKPPSRAEGAASLQIAAVYELQAFLRGDYGKHFQRPAFALLKTVWLSLVQIHANAWKEEFSDILAKSKNAEQIDQRPHQLWKQSLDNVSKSQLAIAINDALTRDHGKALQDHKNDLPNALLAGLFASNLELHGINLTHINLKGARLGSAQLQGVNLMFAQLQGVNLVSAQLQGAQLRFTQLQGADLEFAELQGADLEFAKLQGADLEFAKLQGTDLRYAKLQGTDLRNADLQGADLRNANLQGVNLSDAKLQGAVFNPEQLTYLNLSEEQLASIIIMNYT